MTEPEKENELRAPAAARIRQALARARTLAVRIIGHPGSGKTELLEATLKRMHAPKRVAVIVINPAAGRDAARLKSLCGFVGEVNSAVPAASAVGHVLSGVKLDEFDHALIEAAGGLGSLHDLGQDATVAVFAVSGGDDKAAEYHTLLKSASAVLLTKCDLRPLVRFDSAVFRNDVRSINPAAEVMEISAPDGSGIQTWIGWLERLRRAKLRNLVRGAVPESNHLNYFG